jgi:hypothetical protein
MVEYICENCGKSFPKKYPYDKHIGRKKSCSKQIGEVKAECHTCKKCGKSYASYTTLYKHTKICNSNNTIVDNRSINNINNQIHQNIKKQNNLNVDGDVKVVKFGNENLSYISDDLYKQILGRGFKAVEEFIEHSHFNRRHPENHNIYIANLRDDLIIYYDGDKWLVAARDDLMEDIIYAKSDFLFNKFRQLKDYMKVCDVVKFTRFMDERGEIQTMERLKGEIKLQMYNNRDLPKGMRRKMEKLEKMRERHGEICEQEINLLEYLQGNYGDNINREKLQQIVDILNRNNNT